MEVLVPVEFGSNLVKLEHAYAHHDDLFEVEEEDPLKLPDTDLVAIKTEIKTELDEIKMEEPDSCSPEEEQLAFDTADMSDNYGNVENFHNTPLMDSGNDIKPNFNIFNSDLVPKWDFLDLERKYQATSQSLTELQLTAEKLSGENRILKSQVTRLKSNEAKRSALLKKNTKNFYQDLKDCAMTEASLRSELQDLKQKHKMWLKALDDYDSVMKNNTMLQNKFDQLSSDANRLAENEKKVLDDMNKMKLVLVHKERENVKLRTRLNKALDRFGIVKGKLSKYGKLKKISQLRAVRCEELEKQLVEALRSLKVYEEHSKLVTNEFTSSLRAKENDLEKCQGELANMTSKYVENCKSYVSLKERYKKLMTNQYTQLKEVNKERVVTNQRVSALRNKLVVKTAEMQALAEKFDASTAQAADSKNKVCDYCGF